MLSVETFVVRYTATNCYLIYSRQDGEGLIIDPGDISALERRTNPYLNP